jgi:hypothetical protein
MHVQACAVHILDALECTRTRQRVTHLTRQLGYKVYPTLNAKITRFRNKKPTGVIKVT